MFVTGKCLIIRYAHSQTIDVGPGFTPITLNPFLPCLHVLCKYSAGNATRLRFNMLYNKFAIQCTQSILLRNKLNYKYQQNFRERSSVVRCLINENWCRFEIELIFVVYILAHTNTSLFERLQWCTLFSDASDTDCSLRALAEAFPSSIS